MISTKETVLLYLIDLRLVSSEHDGDLWLTKEKISGFGGKTAAELITEGHVGVVLEHLKRIADGGYA